MPTVRNISDGDLMVPVGFSLHGKDKIVDHRRLRPEQEIEVSEDTLDTCLKMGCALVLSAPPVAVEDPVEKAPEKPKRGKKGKK